MDIVSLWKKTLQLIKGEVASASFETFFKNTVPIETDSNELTLLAPNEFAEDILRTRYLNLIESCLSQLTSNKFEIKIISDSNEVEQNPLKTSNNNHNINNNSNNNIIRNYPRLNPKYTFDTFVIGNSNRFAHAACVAVAESPAKAYNPLFLYGGVGLGKTHLMHAIGHSIMKEQNDAKVVYVSSEKFTNELINSIKSDKNEEFRNKYRNVDILLIDDIQFIAGKEGTQEEFFHTFNTLYESKKQIVLTSDRPPRDIATLEDRLKTRFEWGLTADVQPPDFETRMAIIKRKAELVGLSVPDNVCEFIAQKLKSNIRQLEGTVKKLNAIHLVEGATPTISTAQRAISDIVNNEQPAPVTVSKIIEEVGRTYGVSPEDIKSSKRNANVSFARQISMYVVREITQMPMVEIGKEFGGRDHSTVVYAIQQIEEKSARDPVTKATVSDIIKNIRDR